MPQFLQKKQENEPMYTGCGFSAKGVSVEVSEKATLTTDTCNMELETIIKDLAQ